MITYFVLWCYLLIQGMAHNTGVLPLAKGRALQDQRQKYTLMKRYNKI
jgi:hypothetical protein